MFTLFEREATSRWPACLGTYLGLSGQGSGSPLPIVSQWELENDLWWIDLEKGHILQCEKEAFKVHSIMQNDASKEHQRIPLSRRMAKRKRGASLIEPLRDYTADDDLFTNEDDLGHEETISSSTSISKHSQAFVLWCFSMHGHCWVLHCHHSTARHLQVDRETWCTHGYMSSSQRISLWVLCALEKGSMCHGWQTLFYCLGEFSRGVCKGHHGMCSRSALWSIMVFLWRQLLFQIADG